MAEINPNGGVPTPTPGSAGLQTQMPGQATTVSNVANATGGIEGGNLIETDIDNMLFKFRSDDTPLMQLMLKAKKVKVKSPVVEHYMIDEPRSIVTTTAVVNADAANDRFTITVSSDERSLLAPYTTLICKDVAGYDEKGQATPGKDLMIFVIGKDASKNPICTAVNGKKMSGSEYCQVPAIPAGTVCVILSNALYETQKEVAPDLVIPQPTEVYLQKRGMNQIVSDYYEAQKKRIPFSQALIAEAAITNFKVKGNRTLYASRKGKLKVETDKVGVQDIYCTEGVRYQVKKTIDHTGKWTIEQLIALAKMAYTGEDVPKVVIALCGKNFLENIQCIDYSKHPEVQITSKTNPVGWTVTAIHTVFGDIELKHDPTLDRLKWSNSAFVVAPDRLVHYEYSAEHTDTERIEGEEATRKSILTWDALALKGTCHIWVNGEEASTSTSSVIYEYWDKATAPSAPVNGHVYYFLEDCALSGGISAKSGETWKYEAASGGAGKWVEFVFDINAA